MSSIFRVWRKFELAYFKIEMAILIKVAFAVLNNSDDCVHSKYMKAVTLPCFQLLPHDFAPAH